MGSICNHLECAAVLPTNAGVGAGGLQGTWQQELSEITLEGFCEQYLKPFNFNRVSFLSSKFWPSGEQKIIFQYWILKFYKSSLYSCLSLICPFSFL